jgi:hypothetical protein
MDSGSDSDFHYEDFDIDEPNITGDARLSTRYMPVDEPLELIVYNPSSQKYDLGE